MRRLSVICVLLLVGCGDDSGATSPDAALRDGPGLTFRDGSPASGDGARDRGAPGDGTRDVAGDARRDGPLADVLSPDVLSPDVLPPDVLPPDVLPADTLAHQCTSFAEFQCTPQGFISCVAVCTDHNKRKLQITCIKSSCFCIVNGQNKKTCAGAGITCNSCQQAFSCCNFPSL